jgi:hypothetical protein
MTMAAWPRFFRCAKYPHSEHFEPRKTDETFKGIKRFAAEQWFR